MNHDQITTSNWIWGATRLWQFYFHVKEDTIFHMEAAYFLGATHLDCLLGFPLAQWIQVGNMNDKICTTMCPHDDRYLPYNVSTSLLYLLLEGEGETLAAAVLGSFAVLRSEE